eukprot:scaffold10210_cov127-Skeletonema_dohrnii-CCMP3373.AAC.3
MFALILETTGLAQNHTSSQIITHKRAASRPRASLLQSQSDNVVTAFEDNGAVSTIVCDFAQQECTTWILYTSCYLSASQLLSGGKKCIIYFINTQVMDVAHHYNQTEMCPPPTRRMLLL